MNVVIVLQEFGLQLGHIHIGGALAFTGLAGDAQVQDIIDFLLVEGIFILAVIDVLAQNVGPAPGRLVFVARGHESWTESAPYDFTFTAIARSIAFFYASEISIVLRKIKGGFNGRIRLSRDYPEVLRDGWGIHYFCRVEHIVGIPGLFQAFQQLVIVISQHKRDKFSPGTTVAMLPAH